MKIPLLLLLLVLRQVLTIRVPTSWTVDQQSTNSQRRQQLKPYGIKQQRPQNLNLQQFNDNNNQNGWVPIIPNYNNYYFLQPPPQKLNKFKKTTPLLKEQQWQKFGLNPPPPPNESEKIIDNQQKPDGHEIFEKQSKLFATKQQKFRDNRYLDDDDHYTTHNREDRNEDDEFTPTRIYSQVRQYENKQHLPQHEETKEPRLRQMISDTKIHTIYSEEGYEDSGYDHGGHEKQAEEDEGYGEFEKEIERNNKDDEMQISSEIKLVKKSPNNNTEMHKYVKIVPKSPPIELIGSESQIESMIRLKRTKRTINDQKYPYYNRYDINQDSPLRYAENSRNIPDKQNDHFAFYHQSDDQIDCTEIDDDIDPIRNIDDKIRNRNESGDGDIEQLPQVPRLKQLGDKIECFKMRYFGVDPLDNPLFEETTIGPVQSIFQQQEALNSTITDTNLGRNILIDIIEQQREQRNFDDTTISEGLTRIRRRRIKRPNRFVTTTLEPYPAIKTTKTTPIISEVHYKNEIKPDEQLAVLNDIINNINQEKEPSKKLYITTLPPPNQVDDDIELLKISTKTSTTSTKPETVGKFEHVVLSPPIHPNQRYQTIYRKTNKKPAINQYFVEGMKPPPPVVVQQLLKYPEFKKNPIKRRRFPRNTPHYRNRNKPIDIDDDDDVIITVDNDDDYVPHRPKNYHYDEKLGRIVYDKVNTEAASVEDEIEEILITEVPLPKPIRKNQMKFVKNPDEPSFLEFINKLQNSMNYKQITEPPPTTTTTTTTVAPLLLSTTPSEFLSLLSKIKANQKYQQIDDKVEATTIKTTTTTTTTTTEKEIVEDQDENIQNSPGNGVRTTTAQNYQIFDINDYLPKIKNYSFHTSIDTSKYKTIERPIARNRSIEDNVEELMDNQRELSEIRTTTTKPTTTITTTKRRLRNRTTKSPTTTTTTTERMKTTTRTNKPKRVYPRRRVARIRLTTDETEENRRKIVQRRHQPETTTSPPTTTTTTINNVTIFKGYDKTKKHGGNYRRQEIKRLSDVVPKPITFYTDPTLPNNINRLMEMVPTTITTTSQTIDDYDGDISREDDEIDENTKSTIVEKIPTFIKDPGQRLYYYAPA